MSSPPEMSARAYRRYGTRQQIAIDGRARRDGAKQACRAECDGKIDRRPHGHPLRPSLGLVASGGASTALSQIFQTKQPQLVDVQLPDGSTQKQWITPGTKRAASPSAAKAKDDESYRPFTDPAERAKFGIRNEDKTISNRQQRKVLPLAAGAQTSVSQPLLTRS